MNARTLVASFAFLSLVAGCGPHWTVVKQADPNPLTKQTKFLLDKVSLDGLRVGSKTEAEWLQSKDADTKSKWEGDKVAINDEFATAFHDTRENVQMATAPDGAFTIKPKVVNYEPGFNVGVAASNAEIQATIDIVDPQGNVVDEFQVKTAAGGMSAGQRARTCAHQAGSIAAKYVRKRIGLD